MTCIVAAVFLLFTLIVTTTADTTVQAPQKFQWENQPKTFTTFSNGVNFTCEPGTDYWQVAYYNFTHDNGPFYYTEMEGAFEASVMVKGAYKELFHQAGLMIRIDEKNWIKTGIEFVDNVQHVSAVVTRGWSDWSVVPTTDNPPHMWLKLLRRGDAVTIYYSFVQSTPSDKDFTMLRLAYFPPHVKVKIGVVAAAPGKLPFDVSFEQIEIKSTYDVGAVGDNTTTTLRYYTTTTSTTTTTTGAAGKTVSFGIICTLVSIFALRFMATVFPANNLLHSPLESDTQLSDSGLAVEWLLTTLSRNCPEYCDALGEGSVCKVLCNDISEGKGFVSKVYKTVLHFADAPKPSCTVMMKVPTTEHFDRILAAIRKEDPDATVPSSMLDVFDCHNVECKVYDTFRHLKCIPLPTVWHTQQASKETVGVILMDDMADDNVCPGLISSLNAQQVKNANRYLAAFHSHLLSMSADEVVELERIPHTRQVHIDDYGRKLQHDTLKKIPEYDAGEFKAMFEKVMPALANDFAKYALVDRPTQLGVPLILCHGDAGAHNIFFKKASDGTVSNEIGAFFDWQIAFKGNPMFDMSRIVYPFCDPDVRREVEETLVQDYHDHLKTQMSAAGRSLDCNIEQLREAYALCAVHQTMELVIRLPFFIELKQDEFSNEVKDAWRQKTLLRANRQMNSKQ
ncbi:hypothetical protein AAVH_16825 [Aphelenchoides avenae]|nr:hypothetical protein AAVH_16825 [Aphelenchus avenae]